MTRTTYLGGYVYQNDSLQSIAQEEGRIRKKPDGSYVYDYYIKDHLGNTRVVLTDEEQTDAYPVASLETSTLNNEKIYYNIPDDGSTRINKNTVAGYPADSYTDPNDYIQRLSGSGTKVGTSITLKVMAGDSYHIRANSWYRLNGVTPGIPVNPLTSIIAALAGGVAEAGGWKNTSAYLQSSGILDPAVTDLLNSQTAVSGKPKAYLNWLLLDEQYRYAGGGYEQVGDNEEFKTHIKTGLTVNKNGYLYIYVSNETPNVDVFFDNVQVSHVRGPLLEETHYYPFGLTMAGISSKAAGKLENKYKFNKGSELQHQEFSDGSGLEWYDTHFRNLDPQLGRWWQVDPKANESESPYASMSNNPIRFNDPLGDTIIDAQLRGDKNLNKAYNTFLNSRAGKRFVKLYSPGGKYGATTVEFKVGSEGTSGNTKAFSINRADGTAIELKTDKKYDGIDQIAKGESKSSYLKFDVTIRSDNMSNSVEQVEGAETILHETQHVRMDQQTLITDKAMASPFIQHRDWMKPITSQWYQERAGFYIENRQLWQADYERQKAQGKVKSESEYVRKKVNDFFN